MSKEFLRKLPLFAELREPDLDRLYEAAEPVEIRNGQFLIREGEPGDSLYIIVDGEFEVTKRIGDEDVVLSVRRTGEHIGEMSLLDQTPRYASVRALRDSRVMRISQAGFKHVLACSPSAVTAILRGVTSRLRSTETLLVQNEKMAALGILAAGLAHELNNPAAAVRRSSDQLRAVLTDWQRHSTQLDSLALDEAQMAKVMALREGMGQRSDGMIARLDPLARSDDETRLEEWLAEHGVDQAWELAPALVTLGWDTARLQQDLETNFASAELSVVIPWLTSGSLAYALLDEVGQGAQRISEIVRAVKNYSYLDQGPVQEIDVHEGLENTLIILKHKLGNGVIVKRDFATSLPQIESYASELNQVWTNLIDNAIDAMRGKGEITIRTYASGSNVVVEIGDTGPGIPPEVQAHIFEPFFTTKDPGSGTGLGLHIVYNIVVDKHRGQISVTSGLGGTCFQVKLPVKLMRESMA